MLDFENGLSELRRLLVRRELDLAADHEIGHLLGRRALDVQNIDQPSAAKDCASVGDLSDLLDLMSNEDDCLSALLELLHDLQEILDLLRSKDSRRLVEDKDLGFAVEHLQDLDALLDRDVDIRNQVCRVDFQTVVFRELGDFFICLFHIHIRENTELLLHGLDAEDDILTDGVVVDQLEVLVDHTDILLRSLGR